MSSPALFLGGLALLTLLLVLARLWWRLPQLPPASPPLATLVIDTSALVDGRLVHVLALTGDPRPVLVPGEVVAELELLASSREEGRKRRAARGLHHLALLRARAGVHVEETLAAPTLQREGGVDRLLLERCAAGHGLMLATLDGPLCDEARGLGLPCLSVGELATALVGPHRPGAHVAVRLTGPARHAGQAAGHLEDGTRVVVDGGAGHIGQLVEAQVIRVSFTRHGHLLLAELPREPGAEARP